MTSSGRGIDDVWGAGDGEEMGEDKGANDEGSIEDERGGVKSFEQGGDVAMETELNSPASEIGRRGSKLDISTGPIV